LSSSSTCSASHPALRKWGWSARLSSFIGSSQNWSICRALRSWAFSGRLRGQVNPPENLARVVRWLETATIPMTDLVRPGTGAARTRALLDRISKTKDGTLAAANTANRKRAVLNNAMQYAVEMNVVPANPLKTVKWTRPPTLKTVDPRAVVNADQARRFLAAVGELGPRGERMVAFFGCMYYAALRPEEATDLRDGNLASPAGSRMGRDDPD
jgi:integrase